MSTNVKACRTKVVSRCLSCQLSKHYVLWQHVSNLLMYKAFWCILMSCSMISPSYFYLVIICPGTALLGLAMEWSHWAWGQVQVPPASFCGCPVTAWLNGFLRWRNRSLWLGLQLGPGFYREKISLCTWEDQDKIGTLKIINTHYK